MPRWSIFAVLLVLGPAASAQAPVDTTSIFRHANFGLDWKVVLGKPVGVPPSYIKSGTVEVVASGIHRLGFYESFDYGAVLVVVTIFSDSEGVVASMRFDYGPEYDFDHERKSYSDLLGDPTRDEAVDDQRVVVWEDAVTRFVLIRETTPQGVRSFSELSDTSASRR